MKTDNNMHYKQLADLFNEMILINPSTEFSEKLMLHIEKEAAKASRKQKWITIGQLAAAVGGILLIPGISLYIYSLLTPGFSIVFPSIYIKPLIFLTGLAFLILLVADMLMRKYLSRRHPFVHGG